jgi:hypothetical protein
VIRFAFIKGEAFFIGLNFIYFMKYFPRPKRRGHDFFRV